MVAEKPEHSDGGWVWKCGECHLVKGDLTQPCPSRNLDHLSAYAARLTEHDRRQVVYDALQLEYDAHHEYSERQFDDDRLAFVEACQRRWA